MDIHGFRKIGARRAYWATKATDASNVSARSPERGFGQNEGSPILLGRK
ncbi:MAG: hypothetical protein ACE5R6_18480 [Candidatus Heimdallarchaeota archaeon]